MTAPAPPRSPYEALSSVPTFAGLSEDTRRLLAEKARPLRVPRGTVLVRQGDASDELYIVVTGRCAVSVERREGIIAEIGPGEPIGELSFFGHSPRSATVTAARDSDVLILTRKTFSDLTPAAPEILTVILASVARRLSALTATAPMIRRKRPRLVAVLTIRPGEVAATDVAHALAGAIAPRQAEVFRPDSTAHEIAGTVAERLAVLERNADLVICPVEPDGSGGLPEVLRHCDELLLLAHVGAGPPARPDPVEAAASALFAKEHRTVLLCRDRGAQPISGTSNWLRGREVGLHHHLALDQPSEFARLGRFVLGKALGLVLGGGAAYGCAHLGVAKALGEAGIPVDFLGGTSVGAAMAAALATGAHPDAVLDQTEEIFVRQRAMRRITVPVHALLDHHTLDASLRRH
jgi:NTE family protein